LPHTQIGTREDVKKSHLRTTTMSKPLSCAEDIRLHYDPERPAEHFLATQSPEAQAKHRRQATEERALTRGDET
jgi:hypothetical protein